MERRDAVKNIVLAFGSTIAIPQLLSILTSCSHKKAATNYLCIHKKQSTLIRLLSQILLPVPQVSTKENIDVVSFLDQMLFYTASEADKEFFIKGNEEFEQKFYATYAKKVTEGSIEEVKALLDKFLTLSEEEEENTRLLLQENIASLPTDKKSPYLIYTFLTAVRYYCLFGYCTSKAYSLTPNIPLY